MARSATRPIPLRWWLRPVSRQARVGEHRAVVRKFVRRTPSAASRSRAGWRCPTRSSPAGRSPRRRVRPAARWAPLRVGAGPAATRARSRASPVRCVRRTPAPTAPPLAHRGPVRPPSVCPHPSAALPFGAPRTLAARCGWCAPSFGPACHHRSRPEPTDLTPDADGGTRGVLRPSVLLARHQAPSLRREGSIPGSGAQWVTGWYSPGGPARRLSGQPPPGSHSDNSVGPPPFSGTPMVASTPRKVGTSRTGISVGSRAGRGPQFRQESSHGVSPSSA